MAKNDEKLKHFFKSHFVGIFARFLRLYSFYSFQSILLGSRNHRTHHTQGYKNRIKTEVTAKTDENNSQKTNNKHPNHHENLHNSHAGAGQPNNSFTRHRSESDRRRFREHDDETRKAHFEHTNFRQLSRANKRSTFDVRDVLHSDMPLLPETFTRVRIQGGFLSFQIEGRKKI